MRFYQVLKDDSAQARIGMYNQAVGAICSLHSLLGRFAKSGQACPPGCKETVVDTEQIIQTFNIYQVPKFVNRLHSNEDCSVNGIMSEMVRRRRRITLVFLDVHNQCL